MTDPNHNRTGVRFDALGMVVATAVMGKPLTERRPPAARTRATTSTLSTPRELRASDDPTDASSPTSLATVPVVRARRKRGCCHKDPTTPWLETYVYTDGLGRVALTKARGRAGAPGDRALVHARTARSTPLGRNRAGRLRQQGQPGQGLRAVLRQQPDYTDESELVEQGVTSITRYDPLGRAYRVDNPNGTFRTVGVRPLADGHLRRERHRPATAPGTRCARPGRWPPNANEADAATKAAVHYETPTLTTSTCSAGSSAPPPTTGAASRARST